MYNTNLDCQTIEDLEHIKDDISIENTFIGEDWEDAQMAVILFQDYADAKARAMRYRLEGKIKTAGRWEEHCELVYSALPDFAKW